MMRDLPIASQRAFLTRESEYYTRQDLYRFKYDDYVQLLRTPEFDSKYYVAHKDPWTYCNLVDRKLPIQGWKIHISGLYDNHFEILRIVFDYAVRHSISLKFVTNRKFFCAANGRESSRPQHGKTIVLYPEQNAIKETLEDLYLLLKGYKGPYILTDRPYKDSEVIYYRYGEIAPVSYVDEYETIATKIYVPNMQLVVDKRNPYYELPEGIDDLFVHERKDAVSTFLSKYKVTGVLHFSSQGGVYEVLNNDGKKYVAKEARGFAAVDLTGRYGTDRIKKEYEVLKAIGGAVAPEPIELIEDSGNVYLVEEYIQGKTLLKYPFENSPLIVGFNNIADYRSEYEVIVRSALQALSEIEKKGIVIGDISTGNIVFDRDNKNIKFIDFETARHEYDSEVKETFITPGYVTVNQVDALHGDLQKICIALMECIYPYTQMYFKFPYKIVECIESLMSTGVVDSKFLKLYEEILAGRILRADEALRFLDSSVELKRVLSIARKTPKEMQKGLLTTLKNNYNRYNNREIYNIPCDAAGYNTNNYSLAYGSAGVLNALIYMNEHETVRNCPDVIRELIKSVYSGKVHTQGLYLGKSGIAVSLLKAGFNEQAECIMKTVSISNITMADISYGIAGVMMADIEFYMSTEDDYYRRDYYACVEKLRSLKDDERIRWKDAVGDYYHGFTRGNAGIALALLQGLILFDDDSLKKLSIEVLEEDIKAIEYGTEGEIKGFSSLPDSKSTKIYSPYVHSGLCGMGIVLIRFGLVTGDKRFEMIVDDILGSLKNRRPLFAGWLRGITGILSFINDCIYYLNRSDLYELRDYYLRLSCLYCVGGDECKLIGDELYAASDDLFTGSSGLLMELYRSFNNVISNGFIIGDNAFYKYKNTNERGYRDYDRSIIGPSEAC